MKLLNRKHLMICAAIGLLSASGVYADDGMIKSLSGFDVNETKPLKNTGITVGAWANAGITYNSTDPDNKFNGPVTFGDRSSEFQLNQLNVPLLPKVINGILADVLILCSVRILYLRKPMVFLPTMSILYNL
jgi:hypothetical protein